MQTKADAVAEKTHFALLAVGVTFVVALSLRLACLHSIQQDHLFEKIGGDGVAYLTWAKQIRQDGWIGKTVFFQSPLYPYMCAIFQSFFGEQLARLLILHALIGAIGCAIVSAAATRLFRNWKAGLVSGLLMACYPVAISYDLEVDKTVLDSPLIAVILWCIAGLVHSQRPWQWFACGMSLGLISLTRENAAALFLPITAWLWVYFRDRTLASRTGWTALLTAGVAAIVLPICLRNMVVGGGFYLSTSKFGLNLYYGNNATADGLYTPLRPGRGRADFELIDSTEIAEQAIGRKLSPGEVSSYWTHRTFQDILQAPIRTLTLNIRKFFMFFSDVEIADADIHDRHVIYAPYLRAADRVFSFGVLLALFAAGCALWWKDRRAISIVPLMALFYAVAVSAFILFGRYRLVIVPILMPVAGASIIAFATCRDRKCLGIATVCALAAYGFARFGDAMLPERIQGANDYNRAMTYERMGDTISAERAYRTAIQKNSGLNDARVNLGLMLTELNRPQEAIELLRDASRNSQDPAIWNNLGMALARAGKLEEAQQDFFNAYKLDPLNSTYCLNLAQAMAMTGNKQQARRLLEELNLKDGDPNTHRIEGLKRQLSRSPATRSNW